LNLRHSRPHDDMSVEFHTEAGPITLVPLPGRRSSLVGVVTPRAAETLRELDDEAFALAIEQRCHSIYGRFEVDGPRSFWPLSGLSAATLVRGRTVLLGEAAHALAPIGAQGFNLTMRDVAALRESLAGAEDPGSPAVLSRYERSRWGDVGSRMVAVDALNRSLLSDLLPVQVARALGLYALGQSPYLRRRAIHLGLAPSGHRRGAS
jgi:2-octaprenyl-6-methoxyphenol hydroxylase